MLILPAAAYIKQHPSNQNNRMAFNSVNGPVNSTNKANVLTSFLTSISNSVNVTVDVPMISNTIVYRKIPSGKGLYHIRSSQLIYSANQLTSLCMVRVFEKSYFQRIYYVTDLYNNLPHIVKLKILRSCWNPKVQIGGTYLTQNICGWISRFCSLSCC